MSMQFIISVYDVKEVEEAEASGDKGAADRAASIAVEATLKTVGGWHEWVGGQGGWVAG